MKINKNKFFVLNKIEINYKRIIIISIKFKMKKHRFSI